jgi:hypothetical protein
MDNPSKSLTHRVLESLIKDFPQFLAWGEPQIFRQMITKSSPNNHHN